MLKACRHMKHCGGQPMCSACVWPVLASAAAMSSWAASNSLLLLLVCGGAKPSTSAGALGPAGAAEEDADVAASATGTVAATPRMAAISRRSPRASLPALRMSVWCRRCSCAGWGKVGVVVCCWIGARCCHSLCRPPHRCERSLVAQRTCRLAVACGDGVCRPSSSLCEELSTGLALLCGRPGCGRHAPGVCARRIWLASRGRGHQRTSAAGEGAAFALWLGACVRLEPL